jgi:hypothetical protein
MWMKSLRLGIVALACLAAKASPAFTNAADFGFSPDATGVENAKALQRAADVPR